MERKQTVLPKSNCEFATLQLACIALVSEKFAWCIAHIVGVLPTFLLCVVPTSKVPNSISADVTNKTDSAVMRRIENRTCGETANMVTVPPRAAAIASYSSNRRLVIPITGAVLYRVGRMLLTLTRRRVACSLQPACLTAWEN